MGTQKARDMSIVPEGIDQEIIQKPGQEIKKEKKMKKVEKEQKEEKEVKGKEKVIKKEKTEKIEPTKPAKKQLQIRKKPLHGKKYREKKALIKKGKLYPLDEALELAKKTKISDKFDPNIEVHINLGLKVEKGETKEGLRTSLQLPNPVVVKKKKIAVFTENPEEAKKAGADLAGADDLIEQIAKSKVDFDIVLATPQMMTKISKLAKILGPKGLMPNPKTGTITEKPADFIKELQAGKQELKSDSLGNIHVIIGKASTETAKLKENFEALKQVILQNRPSGVKGQYPRSVTINVTMGPGIRIKF